MKHKTVGKGEFFIVRLTPEDVLKMFNQVFSDVAKGKTARDYFMYNLTEDEQFRIEVSNAQL